MDQNKPSVLVTGASGFIGSKLISKLSNDCRSVVSMYRQRLPEPLDNVFPVCNDLRSSELLGAPLREIDTVVHLAWEKDREGHSKPVNVLLLKNLIAKMEEAGTKRLILLSHTSASSVSHETFLREKYESESLAINSKIDEVIIVRSPLVMSGVPGEDRHLDAMLNLFRLPVVYPIPFSKDKKFGIVSLNEVVKSLRSYVIRENSDPREIVEISNQRQFSFDEVMKFVCNNYVKKQKFALGTFLGRSVARLMEKISNKGMVSIQEVAKLGILSGDSHLAIEKIPSKIAGFEQILLSKSKS
jgi:nucleoside-diphosphate-sugar epimerase